MTNEARIQKAEAIAAAVKTIAIQPSANVWSKGDIVRVYIDGGRRCSTKYGYVAINQDGTVDCGNTRGCISGQIATMVAEIEAAEKAAAEKAAAEKAAAEKAEAESAAPAVENTAPAAESAVPAVENTAPAAESAVPERKNTIEWKTESSESRIEQVSPDGRWHLDTKTTDGKTQLYLTNYDVLCSPRAFGADVRECWEKFIRNCDRYAEKLALIRAEAADILAALGQ